MITEMKKQVLGMLNPGNSEKLPEDDYSHMKYPRLLPLMNFTVDRYRIRDFGHLMIMHTVTKMGMELLTMSFMPSEGVCVPYLLIDAMSMKKKRCVFVEYYGCGHEDLDDGMLEKLYESYKVLPDYEEKENWYIHERMPYSLIKTGREDHLIKLCHDSVKCYLLQMQKAHWDSEYKKELAAFRERMISEGNPSSKTLEMLLKKDGAIRFMKEAVMPIEE